MTRRVPVRKGEVLMVDDDPEVCRLVEAYFRTVLPGVRVATAGTAKAGLDILHSQHIDVILAEFSLPDMPGTEFLLRARQEFPDAHRVLLTASPEKGRTAGGTHEPGADLFFNKPVDMAAFTRAIERLLPGGRSI